MPPSCSMPSGDAQDGEAAVGLLAQDGGVERAAPQVVHGDDRALLDPRLRRVRDRGRLGLGEQHDRPGCPASSAALSSRSRLYGPQLAGWVSTIDAGRWPPRARTTVSTTQRSRRAVSTSAGSAASPTSNGVGSPSRRLNCAGDALGVGDRVALGGVARRRSSPSGCRHSTDGPVGPRSPRLTTSGPLRRARRARRRPCRWFRGRCRGGRLNAVPRDGAGRARSRRERAGYP